MIWGENSWKCIAQFFFSFRMATVTLELEILSPCNYILGSYAKRRNEINALEWSDNLPVYPKVGCVAQLKTFWSGLSLTRLSAFTLPFCQTIISEKVTLKVWPKKLFWKICMFQQFLQIHTNTQILGSKAFASEISSPVSVLDLKTSPTLWCSMFQIVKENRVLKLIVFTLG